MPKAKPQPTFKDKMDTLVVKIGHEIESVEGESGTLGDNIADGLCHRFADDCNLYTESGEYPEWLRWVVLGMLAKKGITELGQSKVELRAAQSPPVEQCC